MEEWLDHLKSKIEQKSIGVSVFGMGYVGLPLIVQASMNSKITGYGVDINDNKIKLLKSGKSYIDDLSDEQLKKSIENGIIYTSNAEEAIKNTDLSIICVPTPVNEHGIPKLDYIYNVAHSIGQNVSKFNKKHIIVLESTTYPTTTEIDVRNIMEKYELKLGVDYELAFSPERIDPGNKKYQVNNIPKVLGATSPKSTAVIKSFYETLIGTKIIEASSPKVAEFTKLFENIFRQVNIALVNELAQLAEKMQIDMFEVIKLASTKPFGFLPHYPGPGLGGHCIPVDPYYLSFIAKKYKFQTKFIEIASEINENMDEHTFKLISIALNRMKKPVKDSCITIMGYSYKNDIADVRNSPAIPIAHKLVQNGARIQICDNIVDRNIVPYPIVDETEIINSDLVVIITPHSYINWVNLIKSLPENVPVVDTRGVIPNELLRSNDIALGKPIKELNK